MICDEAGKKLSLLLYGELSVEEEVALQEHVESCDRCRAALARERAMHAALDANETAPTPELLAGCRQALHSGLQSVKPAHAWYDFRGWISSDFLKPAAAMALLIAGFAAGRLIPAPEGPRQSPDFASGTPVSTQVHYVQPDPSGGVRIVLDETRQRVLTGDPEDSQIRDLLLNAASGASDPNVRLTAIERLKPVAADPETRSVLSRVLLSDDNAGVRSQAIDLLLKHREVRLAGVLQELLQTEDDNSVRLRCEKALREMNASIETF